MTEYDYVHRVPVRYRDIDTQGIVNNGVFPTYLTECRTQYFEDALGLIVEEIHDIVTARLEIDYLDPVKRSDELTVRLRCADVGDSSFTLEYELLTDDTPVARARSIHVTVNPETGESRPLTDELRDKLEDQ